MRETEGESKSAACCLVRAQEYIYIHTHTQTFLKFPISLIAMIYRGLRVVMMFVLATEWPCWWRQSSVVVLRCVKIFIFIILGK